MMENDDKFETEKFETKVQISEVPEVKPSTAGHTQSYGGEMLTWAREGLITGFAIGVLVGIGVYLLILSNIVQIPAFDMLRNNAPFVFAVLIVLLSAGIGAAGGTVVGIGTPRLNPHPSQGLVQDWKTFILRRKNHDKYIYVPEFKDLEKEERRKSQSTFRPSKQT